MDKQKLQEVFSDKAYVESIAKMSAEDAAKSLREKGVEVTADDLMKVHDFILEHKEQLQNGELDEAALAGVAGGMDAGDVAASGFFIFGIAAVVGGVAALAFLW